MNFVYESKSRLSSGLCREIISRFEKDDRKGPGVSGGAQVQLDIKRSTDLQISGLNEWKDVDDILFKKLNNALEEYKCHLRRTEYYGVQWGSIQNSLSNVKDTGYQIQRVKKNEFYVWHHDFHMTDNRVMIFIWYLNDVPEEHGGATQFHFGGGEKIQPEEGKLIIFPAQWPWLHRGCPVIGDTTKYIITGFIVVNNDTD